MSSATIKTTSVQGGDNIVSSPRASPTQKIFRLTPNSERDGSPVKVRTSSAPLSAKEQKVIDELAMLFSIQEERCLSEAGRETSQLSKTSLTSSHMASDASFIYQHIDFQVLAKCVPGFVKSHLNKHTRYLPETFILRVNYWRRRRALGDDSSNKRAPKEPVVRACTEQAGPSPRVASSNGKTTRPQTVTSAASKTATGTSRSPGTQLTISSG